MTPAQAYELAGIECGDRFYGSGSTVARHADRLSSQGYKAHRF